MRRMSMLLVVLLFSVMAFTGCGGRKITGSPAVADTPAVPLSEILANPASYSGKTVVLDGQISSVCVSLCDFTYKEKNQSVVINMDSGIKVPRVKTGTRVRVTASVLHGEVQTVFTALGLELI